MTATEFREVADNGTFIWAPAEDRLWGRLDRLESGCWEWTGSRNEDGYGVIQIAGSPTKAHRAAWVLSGRGPIPDGLLVMHACDNPPCCNPAHLRLGTVAENNADRHSKGRTVMPTNGPDFWRNKTHCPSGHPYSGDNVRLRPDGRRRCAACYRERAAARRASQKERTA